MTVNLGDIRQHLDRARVVINRIEELPITDPDLSYLTPEVNSERREDLEDKLLVEASAHMKAAAALAEVRQHAFELVNIET
jgi:hypothetical protein